MAFDVPSKDALHFGAESGFPRSGRDVMSNKTIQIPFLDEPYELSITVCGSLKSPPESLTEVIESLNKNDSIFYNTKGNSENCNRVSTHVGDGGDKYLHIDLATMRYFGKRPPEGDTPIEEACALLEKFNGIEIDSLITGRYTIKKVDLPDDGLIKKSMNVKATAGELTVEQTGATFSFNKGPISSVEWSSSRDADTIRIDIDSFMDTKVDHTYLVRARARINELLSSTILSSGKEEKQNEDN